MLIRRACAYAKADGQPCRMAPILERPYCFAHDPERAAEAAEARRLGRLRRKKEGTIAGASYAAAICHLNLGEPSTATLPEMDHGSAAGQHWRRLAAALAVGSAILVAEMAAGVASNSLALLADAGHMFADVVGMGLSLGAIAIASRPRSTGRTFGLYRLEILAASINAVVLLGIGVVILVQGVRRFADPPEVGSAVVIVVAAVALVANTLSLRLLGHGRQASLNMRAAYLEVLGDLLGSGAVLVSALVIASIGWRQADAVASIFIAVLIVPRTVTLLRDSIDVLLEATPKGVDMTEVGRHILDAPGVTDVHDLHAWTITSGMNVVSAHVVLGPDGVPGDVLDYLGRCLSDDFDVDHSTFQLETPEHVRWEAEASMPQH